MIEAELGQGSDGIAHGRHRQGPQGDRRDGDPDGARRRVRAAVDAERRLTVADGALPWPISADKDSKTEDADREEDPRHGREGQAARLARSADPRLLRRHPGLHRVLRQRQGQRARQLPVDLPGTAGSLAARDGQRRARSSTASSSMEIGKALGSLLMLLMVAGVGASVVQNLPQFVGERIRPQALAHLARRGLEAAVRRAGLRRVRQVAWPSWSSSRSCCADLHAREPSPAACRHADASRRRSALVIRDIADRTS